LGIRVPAKIANLEESPPFSHPLPLKTPKPLLGKGFEFEPAEREGNELDL
jgi:hypothetical protein